MQGTSQAQGKIHEATETPEPSVMSSSTRQKLVPDISAEYPQPRRAYKPRGFGAHHLCAPHACLASVETEVNDEYEQNQDEEIIAYNVSMSQQTLHATSREVTRQFQHRNLCSLKSMNGVARRRERPQFSGSRHDQRTRPFQTPSFSQSYVFETRRNAKGSVSCCIKSSRDHKNKPVEPETAKVN